MRSGKPRRGYTLLESLIASSILLIVVIAVMSAITAGQQQAFAARQRILGSLSADALLGRLMVLPYDDLAAWNGYLEPVGDMRRLDGSTMPPAYMQIGRSVKVSSENHDVSGTDVQVAGRRVVVRAFDIEDRTLTSLDFFMPEPQS